MSYPEKCPECGEKRLIRDYDRAEVICTSCGLVVSESLVDTGPEWRAFDQEQKQAKERVGSPTTFTMHDKGLSTLIDWRNKDIHGAHLAPGMRAKIYRLRKWQRRIRVIDAAERNLVFALSELDRMASHLELPKNVKETTALIYRRALQEKLIKGRSIESMITAALYAACRLCRVPRTLEEIAEVSSVDKIELGRSYRYLVRELGIKMTPTNPADYVPRFASALGLSGETQAKAIEILKKASRMGLTSGRGPTGAAAAAIYIASVLQDERRTQRDIAEVVKVTEVTIRNRYKEIVEHLLDDLVEFGFNRGLTPEEISTKLNINMSDMEQVLKRKAKAVTTS